MEREWIYLLPGSIYKNKTDKTLFWYWASDRSGQWSPGEEKQSEPTDFPSLLPGEVFRLQERKGNRGQPRDPLIEQIELEVWAKQLELERKRSREQRNAQKESSGGLEGSLWNIPLSVYRCLLWGDFPSLGKEPRDISKKKTFGAQWWPVSGFPKASF